MTLEAAVLPISLNSKVRLHPLSKQRENGVVIVGRGDQFLELPPEGLDFIRWLDEGMSVAHARERFEARYNPFPDDEVLEVMNAFVECDFVAAVDGQALAPRHAPLESNADWLPQSWARALFSTPALIGWMVFVIPAAVLWVLSPDLWPRRADYFWTDHYSLVVLTGMLIWLMGMLLHETSHWLACRAKGIEATITWTQRLGFFPMSQTIMRNIWAIPRGARLLPLAAGMAWDVFELSLALYALYFDKIGWLALPWLAIKLLKFYVLFITMALAAQFWLFSRMDGYFLVSALLGQRNLQSDTRAWLKSKLLRRGGFETPASGKSFIYMYGLITMIWGGLFMSQFLLVSLPIKIELIWESFSKIWRYASTSALDFYDGAAVFASQVIFYGLLLYAHIREHYSRWRQA
jgi:putative peptide zinc metalloprotease protein